MRFERHDGIFDIILARPSEGNLVTEEMAAAITGALRGLALDVKLIRLLAEGPDFCRGRQPPTVDIDAVSPLEVRQQLLQGTLDMLAAFKQATAPVLGVVRGQAISLGVGLAGLCDVTLAAADAVFRIADLEYGVVPTVVMWALVGRVPDKAIANLVITREPFSAARAAELGIVDRIVPAEQVDAETERLTTTIGTCSSASLRAVKEFLRYAGRMESDAAAAFSATLNAVMIKSRGAR